MSALRTPEVVDDIDAQLLRLLQSDGRRGIAQLAQAVGLAPSSVHERLARLRREEVILGYEAVLDPATFGQTLLVFAEVRLAGASPRHERVLEDAVRDIDEVVECHRMGDGCSYLVKVRVADMAEYRRGVGEALWRLPGVQEVRAYAVIEEVKRAAGLPL